MSLSTSALNTMLSVSASPNCILPSAVMLPVACMLPVTFNSLKISTMPVPLGRSSRFILLVVTSIRLLDICKSSTSKALLYRIVPESAKFKMGAEVVMLDPVNVRLFTVLTPGTSKLVVLMVPTTSKGY